MSLDSNGAELVAATTQHLLLNKYFQLASVVLLLYDHVITFGEEVERVWTKRVTGVTILFLLNRYLSPLLFFIDIEAYHDPRFTPEICSRFVKFEGFTAVIIVAICEMIMMLRVVALCDRHPGVVGLLLTLWTVQISLGAVGFAGGWAAIWPQGVVGCVFVGSGPLFAALWLVGLVSSTTMFLLTLYRFRGNMFPGRRAPVLRVVLRDGTMYFAVVFCANTVNACVYFLAEPGLRALCAPFNTLITSIVASRLVLNLRTAAAPKFNTSFWNGGETMPYSFLDRTLGIFGEELEMTSRGLSDNQDASR